MHRRFFVLALIATACAPTKPAGEETPPDPPARRAEPGKPLLAIAEWSAPVAGWSQRLAVYEDGLLEMRSFEEAPQADNPLGQELQVRVLRVPPAELAPLRGALADSGFEKAEPYYREEGVHDGGSLTIADMATHRRRVIVINSPSGVPGPVTKAQSALDGLAKTVKDKGTDGFAPGPDRIEFIAMVGRHNENLELTVFAGGLLELRTTYTADEKAHAASDYPTPHAVTGQARPGDLDALRSTLTALPATPPTIKQANRSGDMLFVGSTAREFQVPSKPPPEVSAVIAALNDVIDTLRSN